MTADSPDWRKHALFNVLWLLLIAISVHDAYWLWANRLDIEHLELNPQGRLLLHLGGGEVWLFLAAKMIGTILAATLLLILHHAWPRIGLTACAAITFLQVLLLAFLYFG